MGRPKEHDEATRTALLEAAERLVDEHGPDAVAVRAVADAVGTTTRAVYSLFGSKQGLLEALATRLFEEFGHAIDRVPRTEDPVTDVVEAGVQAFRETALAHPSLYRLVFMRVVPDLRLGPQFGTVAWAAFARLEARVARLGSSDSPEKAHERALAVHALTEGLASMELRGNMLDPARAEAIWRDSLTALVRGYDDGRRARPSATPAGAGTNASGG